MVSLFLCYLQGDVPSEISNQLLSDRGKHVVVFCHHGVRSLMGAGALMRLGVENVSSMIGGIAQVSSESSLIMC